MCACKTIAGTSMSGNVEMFSKKRKTDIPVVIVEDHNDVLYHIYRTVGSKQLPFTQGSMIHFDSHPDLMIPKNLDIERIYDKQHVLNSLSIENWIIPAIFAGHFSTIAWIKPPWATQLENGTHKFKIGVEKSSSEIKVTCTQSYFVSELAWCPTEELRNVRDVLLEVRTLGEPVEGPPGSDTEATKNDKPVKDCVFSKDAQEALDRCPYVLDIDLDFYSTRNPFLSMFSEEQFAMLRELYHYENPKDVSDKALLEVTAKRREQLSELESIFNSVRDGTTPSPTPRLEAAQRLLATFPDGRPPDAALLNDAGCTCDDCDLPHHVSTRDHIRHLVGVTKNFLSTQPKPALITIARSSRDDYCPPEDVDFIQQLVLEMLGEVYGSLDVDMPYRLEESDEEIPLLVPIS